jgi:hypothetical protein
MHNFVFVCKKVACFASLLNFSFCTTVLIVSRYCLDGSLTVFFLFLLSLAGLCLALMLKCCKENSYDSN